MILQTGFGSGNKILYWLSPPSSLGFGVLRVIREENCTRETKKDLFCQSNANVFGG